jgi:uncharacterized protein YkwD
MAPVKQKPRMHSSHKKRHGLHHNQGKHYQRVYWPFIPLVTLIVLGVGLMLPARNAQGTLAYATNLSHQSLLDATNAQRQAHGDSSLSIEPRLNAAAQAKAEDMAKRNYWSHTTPEGNEPWYFVTNAGYSYQKAGENLAFGFANSSETINGWMNSPSHRQNMLDNSYSEVGFGFANANNYQGHGGETIVVAMYGVPAPAGTPAPQQTGVYGTASIPVNRIQILTNGQMPWLTFAVGMLSGLAITFLIIRHGLALRKFALEGETFILHHPALDMLLLSLIVLGLFLGRTAGFIV